MDWSLFLLVRTEPGTRALPSRLAGVDDPAEA